jgi:hypothetical protein
VTITDSYLAGQMKSRQADRLAGLKAAMRTARVPEIVEAARLYLSLFESARRPREFLALCREWRLLSICEERRIDWLPEATWRLLHAEWNSFDLVPHRQFASLLEESRSTWSADFLSPADRIFYDALPSRIAAYRGQDKRQAVGLSWTLDRQVAFGFAHGHRGLRNEAPMVICADIGKGDVAGAYQARKESEIVLFSAKGATRRKVIAINDLS